MSSGPAVIGKLNTGVATNSGGASCVKAGKYVFFGGGRGLAVIDVSDPLNPTKVASLNTEVACYESCLGMALSGHFLFAAGGLGMVVIDVSDPTNPQKIASVNTGVLTTQCAGWVTVVDDVAYVAGGMGLSIYDVSDPANPVELVKKFSTGVGEYYSRAYVTVATVMKTKYAFFGGGGGLSILDVTDPADPKKVKKVNTGVARSGSGNQYGTHSGSGCFPVLGPSGAHVYVVGGGGMAVIDVSDPANAKKIKSMETGVCSHEGGGSVFITGNYLYVAGGWGGLTLFDITVPDNPVKIGQKDTGVCSAAGLASVVVEDGRAYVAGGEGFAIIDVSEPETWPATKHSKECIIS
eukprot:6213479-Pleurochrysis_carterae.AAC.2